MNKKTNYARASKYRLAMPILNKIFLDKVTRKKYFPILNFYFYLMSSYKQKYSLGLNSSKFKNLMSLSLVVRSLK